MPLLTRWFIRTSFVYLGLGLAVGILLAGQSLWSSRFPVAVLFPGYIHLLTVGWLTLLIFGVAYWMFPRYSQAQPHGNDLLNWAAFILLNLGLVTRLIGEPLDNLRPEAIWGWLLAVSALLQWLGGMAFIINLWKRVKLK
jgi:heme/copper-type cytochrome/quinol oxidase subunit 1